MSSLGDTKNIFLDAGGVILDEYEQEDARATIISVLLTAALGCYSIDDYWSDAKEAVYRFVPNVYDYILWKRTNSDSLYHQLKLQFAALWTTQQPPLQLAEGVADVIRILSKTHHIGILGQYGVELKVLLRQHGLLDCFRFQRTQEAYRLTKPDPRYFEQVLQDAHVKPATSVMVGDRIDKDIIPAKVIGMKTIRLVTGMHQDQRPRTPDEQPDHQITRIDELIPLFEKE